VAGVGAVRPSVLGGGEGWLSQVRAGATTAIAAATVQGSGETLMPVADLAVGRIGLEPPIIVIPTDPP